MKLPDGTFYPFYLAGTNPELCFHPDGTRTDLCVNTKPRPMNEAERAVYELAYRQKHWLPDPKKPRKRYPKRRNFPLGRNDADDQARFVGG